MSPQLRETYEAVLALVADGVVVVDNEGVVVDANEAAASLLGMRVDRLRGRPLDTRGLAGRSVLRMLSDGAVVVLRRADSKPAMERRRRERQYVDAATGLDNAAGLERALAVACAVAAPGSASGLVLLDVPDGPITLADAASRLLLTARDGDVVARVKDRSFAIVVRDLLGNREIEGIAERVQAAFGAGTRVSVAAVDRPVAPAVLRRLAYESLLVASGA